MILNVLLIAVFLISFAMLFGQGIWGNALTLINVVMAALLATTMFEPLAAYLDTQMPTMTYLWDFICLWGLFALFLVVFRAGSDMLSKHQVRFKQIVDLAGGSILGLWISWVLVCFTAMSLHTAPLARNSFRGDFQPKPDSKMFFGLAPDQQWLGFTQKISAGTFATSPPEGIEGEQGSHVFDPEGKFIFNFGERRARFEKEVENRVHRGN